MELMFQRIKYLAYKMTRGSGRWIQIIQCKRQTLLHLMEYNFVILMVLKHLPIPSVNSTDLDNSTMNSDASVNLSANDSLEIHSKTSLPSPLKQLKSGIWTQDIKCNKGFELVIKATNAHPACVKPTTATRLLSHGWITLEVFVSTHTPPPMIVGGKPQ